MELKIWTLLTNIFSSPVCHWASCRPSHSAMHSSRGYLAYLGKLLHFVQLVFVQPAFNICPICQVAPGQVDNLRGTITIETGPVTQHNGFKSIPAQCCPRPIVLECGTMLVCSMFYNVAYCSTLNNNPPTNFHRGGWGPLERCTAQPDIFTQQGCSIFETNVAQVGFITFIRVACLTLFRSSDLLPFLSQAAPASWLV